jgi:LmbE family N-acetylglucosaminyl deacetylase
VTTIVFVHAHPDDEASATACSMAMATDLGHRVVVIYATNGDHGEPATDLAEGETVVSRRRLEAQGSAAATGAEIRWLDYADSGMAGWEQNDAEGSFHAASTDEAGGRLAAHLDELAPDVVVGYDFHGNYGHPDHVKVHHVVKRALDLHHGRPRYLEVTINRDLMRRQRQQAIDAGVDVGDWDVDQPMLDGHPIGTPEAELHWQVDGRAVIDRKRAALSAHASQTSDVGMMLAIPEDAFREGWGFEHYIEPALGEQPMRTAWPF